ncbi:MAG: YXWGXW repeat-containing protein [Gammaproteobacteria bacterium]
MKRLTTGLLLTAALALSASMLPASSASAQVSIGISVNFAPPPLPYYPQPVLPAPGYIWMPGYWAYGPYGYYWVPGAWVLPPAVGLLWTPGYWGWYGRRYVWHAGYWGPHVGFYGGINYGYGYPGRGYYGGYWHQNHFYYNRILVNVNVRNVYVYSQPVPRQYRGPRVSYNGGKGGSTWRPTKQEQTWAGQRRAGPTPYQQQHGQTAMKNPSMRYKNNHGKPSAAAKVQPPPPMHKPNPKPASRPPQGSQPKPAAPPHPQEHPGKPGSKPPPPEEDHKKKPKPENNKPEPPPATAMHTLARDMQSTAWRGEIRRAPRNAHRLTD